jgi:hypothetical protein
VRCVCDRVCRVMKVSRERERERDMDVDGTRLQAKVKYKQDGQANCSCGVSPSPTLEFLASLLLFSHRLPTLQVCIGKGNTVPSPWLARPAKRDVPKSAVRIRSSWARLSVPLFFFLSFRSKNPALIFFHLLILLVQIPNCGTPWRL